MRRSADREQLREIVHGFALVTQVGLLMVGSILAGLFLGFWIAGYVGGLIGLLAGVAAGFYSCYRVLLQAGFSRRGGRQQDGSPEANNKDE